MNKKNILFISIFLKVSVINSMQLPSEQEVMATKNPLTIVLYCLHVNYLKQPTIPTDPTFEARLANHSLLKQEKWLVKNGFLEELQNLYRAKSSLEDVRTAIEKKSEYQQFGVANMLVTQQILMANLLQAYKDCSLSKL